MEAIFQFVDEVDEAQSDTYCAIADDIWDHPETRFEEFWSAQRLADALEAEGFQLTRDAGGIPNAFIASVGEGQPVIALLGEFDALAGLSQQAQSAEPTPLTPGANGHGCGHNLLGTAAFAAAVAAKGWLQQHGDSGTLRFYGCPGEEGGSGKTFMVREGLFDDVDAALTWHPEAWAGMFSTRTLATIQAAWRFTGTAAHAANSPHLGRSALDAVTEAVRLLEECPLFNAGMGAVFTRDQTHELDACVMDGYSLQAGAVAGVKHLRNPVLAARLVLEKSPHVLLIGEGAENFAISHGMARVDNDLFSTPERLLQLQEAKAGGEIILDHHAAPLDERQKMGTVGAVALDLAGNLAAATSTGGMTNKLPGRVGDSPLPGAGCYANNASVAVSCTGTGEVFMRTLAAYDIAALVEYGQLSLYSACGRW